MPTLSEFVRAKVPLWASDKTINPSGAKVEIHSVYIHPKSGRLQASYDVVYGYAGWIQLMLTPFYAIFATFSLHEALEWLEDIAYFKRITPWGIKKKRVALEETKRKIGELIEQAVADYNNREENQDG